METLKSKIKIIPEWLPADDRQLVIDFANNPFWEPGRQGSGYEKCDLTKFSLGLDWIITKALHELGKPWEYDAWLLRYPAGSSIPSHTDPNHPGLCHVRLNAIVSQGLGGELCIDEEQVPLSAGDAYIFRPDITRHKVSELTSGERLVLSVGANLRSQQVARLAIHSEVSYYDVVTRPALWSNQFQNY